MASKSPGETAAAKLRRFLQQDGKTVFCPGVYDGITARIALNTGFDCLYMTGAGTAASRLGLPDLGLATMGDMAANASMIASLDRSVPVIADADTGYGGPLMVARIVHAYMAGGVAALHLEDQVITKRCGHLSNKELVDEHVYLSRIRAACMAREEARRASGGAADIVIIARSDALQSLGYDAAVSRLAKAIALGADVAFLEGTGFKVTTRKTTYALTYVSISIALHATRPCCGRGSLHGTPATCGYRGNCGNFIRGLTSTTVPIVDSTNLKYPLTNIPWSKTRISAHQRQLMNDDLTGRRAPNMHLTIDLLLTFPLRR
jgi:2-methylisocitrate lyase-like PEP mutase family enzyme